MGSVGGGGGRTASRVLCGGREGRETVAVRESGEESPTEAAVDSRAPLEEGGHLREEDGRGGELAGKLVDD